MGMLEQLMAGQGNTKGGPSGMEMMMQDKANQPEQKEGAKIQGGKVLVPSEGGEMVELNIDKAPIEQLRQVAGQLGMKELSDDEGEAREKFKSFVAQAGNTSEK